MCKSREGFGSAVGMHGTRTSERLGAKPAPKACRVGKRVRLERGQQWRTHRAEPSPDAPPRFGCAVCEGVEVVVEVKVEAGEEEERRRGGGRKKKKGGRALGKRGRSSVARLPTCLGSWKRQSRRRAQACLAGPALTYRLPGAASAPRCPGAFEHKL